MFIRTDDPIRDYDSYDAEQWEIEQKLPKCSICGDRIYTEKAVKLDGEFVCDDCIDNMREYVTTD